LPKAEEERVRVEIGFEGGQAMSVVVSAGEADELEKRLADGTESAATLEAEDGRYTLALNRVAYVKRFGRESRVGFAG
jgi:hypothetical protein